MFDGDFCQSNAIVSLFLTAACATKCSDKPAVINLNVNILKIE